VPHLFEPLTLRSVTLSNRVAVSPMCEYSSEDGFANDWHLVHLGSRAVGGAGLVVTEATAVEARGRITARDLGLWKDAHVEFLSRIVRFLLAQGAVPGVQLAHAGRKASTAVPWEGGAGVAVAAGGWEPIAPSAIPFSERTLTPRTMSHEDIAEVVRAFAAATRRAVTAGFRLIELHFAHGYLVHEFLSPLSNRRDDAYGGAFEQRIRLALEIARTVRAAWPDHLPLIARLSCTDWVEGGWTLEESVELTRRLSAEGVDLVDCSSGGLVPYARIDAVPGYQIPFARRVRAEAGVPTAAVGLISTPAQADAIVREGDADLVMFARAMLRDPYWALHAAAELGHPEARRVPVQYLRAY
jgi:2,4-dienoyl-CoA reductase-like NADH-dependent reductase (Old Yellow Enzyme family)